MATPARCPFYVPNPLSEKFWTWRALRSGAIEVTLTQVKFFGQPGQAPTKCWQPYLNYNVGDNPSWQWKKPYNLILIQRQLPDDQSWFYNQPYDYAVWPGQPRKSALLSPLLTAQRPFFYEYHRFNFNDQALYLIAWTYVRNQSLLTTGPSPFTWEFHRFNYNDASGWQWQYPRDFPLLTPTGAPFVSEAWHYDYNDAAFWFGKPTSSTLLAPILTAGGQLPTPEWNDDYNESSLWSWQYPRDIPLLTPSAPFISEAWHVDYDDTSRWIWQYRRPISLLATPFVSKGWHYDLDHAAFWTWQAPRSDTLAILTASGQPPTPRWHYDFNDQSNWQRYPYRTSLTFISFGNPFVSLGWHYDYNESSLWTWPPPQDRTLYLPVTAVTEPQN